MQFGVKGNLHWFYDLCGKQMLLDLWVEDQIGAYKCHILRLQNIMDLSYPFKMSCMLCKFSTAFIPAYYTFVWCPRSDLYQLYTVTKRSSSACVRASLVLYCSKHGEGATARAI
ncbi:hypothetical protein ABZP36_035493 [Zizania latifolia]